MELSLNRRPLENLGRIFSFATQDMFLTCIACTAAILFLGLGVQVTRQFGELQVEPQEKAQLLLAQLDTELLSLDLVAREALLDPERIFQFKLQLHSFRKSTEAVAGLCEAWSEDMASPPTNSLSEIQASLNRADAELAASDGNSIENLARAESEIARLRKPVGRVVALGLQHYAESAKNARAKFANVLQRAAFFNSILILAIGAALLLLARQIAISKRRENALIASSERNESTVNASLDGVIVFNSEGAVIEFNPAAEKIFGCSRNVAAGCNVEQLVKLDATPDDLEADGDFLKKLQKHLGIGRIEMTARHFNGTPFPAEWTFDLIQGSEGNRFIAYVRDITRRTEQERALLRARDQALEAVRAKSQFLAVMSHEMRTPLNGVMAILDLLSATTLSRKQKTYVKTATTASEILQQHIDDVLDLTRIQAGKLDFFPRAFNLVELLEEIQSLNVAVAATRGNRIILNVDMPQPYFVADRKRLHQVLTNLVGNAIKFTENGTVEIKAGFVNAKADMVTVEFSVTDTGIGIDESQQACIFEEFVRLEADYQHSVAGTGLGLPICRNIVAAMGGKINVRSARGKGATFEFQVPLKAAFAAAGEKPKMALAKVSSRRSRRMKILVVEDNETNRFVAVEMLRAANCQVGVAENGIEGVKAARRQKFDLILMDISMRKMNGWDATRAIRANPGKCRDVPIYALTAHALPEERAALIEAGMQGSLTKPVRARDLHSLIDAVRDGLTSPGANLAANGEDHSYPPDDGIDGEILAELRDLLSPEMFQHRLTAYIEELAKDARILAEPAAFPQRQAAAQFFHRMAGSAAVFGARPLRDRLLQLEHSLKSDDDTDLAAQCGEVHHLALSYADVYGRYRTPIVSEA